MIIDFLFSPSSNISKNNSLSSKIRELFFAIPSFLVLLCVAGFIEIFVDLFVKSNYNFSIKDVIITSMNDFTKEKDSLFIFFLFPILEEFTFRLPLLLKKNYIFISISSFLLFFAFADLAVSICIFFIILFLFFSRKHWEYYIINLFSKHYKKYFYFMSIFFGALHILNFSEYTPNNLLFIAPLYVLPQFIMGLFLGYIRLKNGIIFSIIAHFLFNAPYIFKHYVFS